MFATEGTTRKIIPVCRKLTNEIVFCLSVKECVVQQSTERGRVP